MLEEKRQLIASAIQITAVDGEKQATVEKMTGWLDLAGARGSDLVVLPELWTGLGFSDETIYKEIAETFPGPVTDMLCDKARTYGMYIAGVHVRVRRKRHLLQLDPADLARGRDRRSLPQDPSLRCAEPDRHPGRDHGIEEGQTGRQPGRLRHQLLADRPFGLLGSAVSRGLSRDGVERRRDPGLRLGFPEPAPGPLGGSSCARGRRKTKPTSWPRDSTASSRNPASPSSAAA